VQHQKGEAETLGEVWCGERAGPYIGVDRASEARV